MRHQICRVRTGLVAPQVPQLLLHSMEIKTWGQKTGRRTHTDQVNVNQERFVPVWEPFLCSAFCEEEISFKAIWEIHRQLRGNNM